MVNAMTGITVISAHIREIAFGASNYDGMIFWPPSCRFNGFLPGNTGRWFHVTDKMSGLNVNLSGTAEVFIFRLIGSYSMIMG